MDAFTKRLDKHLPGLPQVKGDQIKQMDCMTFIHFFHDSAKHSSTVEAQILYNRIA